ncbi:MAG: cbb3-type cytochrome c oxidase subunit I [Candidatus Hydrothermarchaeales archaeon]
MKVVKNLTLRFYIAVLIYFLISCTLGALLAAGVIYKVFPNVLLGLAHAHLALVGWVSMTIVGSMYQIVPVLLGTRLDNETLGNYQFWIMNIATVGVFFGFLTANMSLVAIFGAVLAFSFYFFAYIIYKTIKNRGVGIGLTMKFFIAAILYIIISCTFGALMASGTARQLLSKGYLSLAHAHLALVGWVTITIMGAMYQMLPMLSLKELYSERLGEIQFWIVNAGIIGLFLSLIFGFGVHSIQFKIFAAILLISFLLFAFEMFETLLSGEKKGDKLDITVKFFSAAIVYVLISGLMGILMAFSPKVMTLGRITLAHAHLALVGWVSITIIGAMYHLIPMLVWTERYSSKLGKEEAPTIKELYSERLGDLIFWLINAGVIGFSMGLILRMKSMTTISGMVVLVSSYLFSFEMLRIIAGRSLSARR